ncbi:MAG: 4Fe-4S binding protein [Acidobacteria bacterium]|jgi:Fe-S-cluster-containing dehydrogenase component|nr:4Fe-4S binding protein [Acidobacteriota bacterium]
MSISRRGFIGGAVGAALTAGTSEAGTVKKFEGYPGRYGLLHDTTLCVGCRSCEVACKEVNGLPPVEKPIGDQEVFDKTRRTSDTSLTVVNRYLEAEGDQQAVYRKLQCMHCNEPCCATVCLVHAFEKTPEGPVLYHPELCMGCRYCVMACPYNALAYEYGEPLTPRVMRCTMCYDRIKDGQMPGCAEACPMGAITFGRRDELIEVARERIRKYPDRYINHIFGEHEFGGTSWLLLSGVEFGKLDLEEGLTYEPLPAIATSYLGVVPLVVTIYPGLLLGMHAFSKRQEAVAKKEREEAVALTREAAEEESNKKLAAAAERAKKDKERAIEAAVKKALAEAQDGGES